MIDLCDPVRYNKDSLHISMFYHSFKDFLTLQDVLNMDNNIGKGCGFEEFLKNTPNIQVS